MRSIVTINTQIPTISDTISYISADSLRDFDIAVFDPRLPYRHRIEFSGGGSCIDIEGTRAIAKAMEHWVGEFNTALSAGKTVFVMMNDLVEDQGAISSTSNSKTRTYNTSRINNYQALPINLSVKNGRGRIIKCKDTLFAGILNIMKGHIGYRVIIQSKITKDVYNTKDGDITGGVIRLKDMPGHLILLPYFDFDGEDFVEIGDNEEEIWTASALAKSKALVSQLVAIDKHVRGNETTTPPPQWVKGITIPAAIEATDEAISRLNAKIQSLERDVATKITERDGLIRHNALLYESGKPLERAVEEALKLLGYSVQSLRIRDLEIDHVITSPSGYRMIGETEGKDNSAIDISKFRQLESNIGEDFDRDEINVPAKGILFANGYRFLPPKERPEQFTTKCLINAKRLGSALIRTPDLYHLTTYLIDHPDDEDFKARCRAAIEITVGEVVCFPNVPEGERVSHE